MGYRHDSRAVAIYSSGASTLKNVSYSEDDLPPLPEGVPITIANLIHNLLERNPLKVRHK
jgi:hypothetical protein